MSDDARWVDALARTAGSTERVVATARSLDDEQLRAPSLLPGWSRGHLLTHVARNADSLVNLATWAATGIETPAYASPQAREDDIERGAGRSGPELVDDLVESARRLADALGNLAPEARDREIALRDGTRLAAHGLPALRLRELEIHHVDLAAGYGPGDWSPAFVTRTLGQLAPMFNARGTVLAHALTADDDGTWTVGPPSGPTLRGTRADLLVWLIGRDLPTALTTTDGAQVPPSPQW